MCQSFEQTPSSIFPDDVTYEQPPRFSRKKEQIQGQKRSEPEKRIPELEIYVNKRLVLDWPEHSAIKPDDFSRTRSSDTHDESSQNKQKKRRKSVMSLAERDCNVFSSFV